jgi:hypothetical protein
MQQLPMDRLLHLLDCLLQLGGCAVARLAYIQSPVDGLVLVVMLAIPVEYCRTVIMPNRTDNGRCVVTLICIA